MTKKRNTKYWMPKDAGYKFDCGELERLLDEAFDAGYHLPSVREDIKLAIKYAVLAKLVRTSLMKKDNLSNEKIDAELAHVDGILREYNVTI